MHLATYPGLPRTRVGQAAPPAPGAAGRAA
ncbi:hypothetical protein JOE68_005476 [Saccharothrix algeriensis]|uniref:Uncharacterized protein n=1 Tax=Saccharothrix algeriensis TaxID=173560 RepID=A0ABS2SEE6_9PSEU|nr:hypothetical protein [Saccharothrix algeriensis]